ncbi:MAG: 2Fe-2S iron-sulfur cluster-binding protein, partial [Thermoplasmatota archaeon]
MWGVPLRVKEHPILSFDQQQQLSFRFNDQLMKGIKGDSIAAALHANGVKVFSTSLKYDRPRGFFCGIGKCSSCLMQVNGVPNVRTCIAPLTEGVEVRSQQRFAAWPKNQGRETDSSEKMMVDVLIVGGGPAGLEAAYQAAELGAKVLIVDENQKLGGQLVKQTHKFFGSKEEKAGTRGIVIADMLDNLLSHDPVNENISLMLDATVFGFYEQHDVEGF